MTTMSYAEVLTQQVVARREPDTARIFPLLFLFGCLLLQLWVRIEVVRASYHLEEVRSQALRNDAVLRELRSDHAAATGPRQLSERARRKLGLEPLPPQQVRTLVDVEGQ